MLAVIVYVMFGVPTGSSGVFFHLDFGVSCSYPGCPAIKELWSACWQADVYLLLGGLVLGVTTGLAAAAFCAGAPAHARDARASRRSALIFYSMPAYLFGFGVLLLFEPSFGALPSAVLLPPVGLRGSRSRTRGFRAGDDRPLDLWSPRRSGRS